MDKNIDLSARQNSENNIDLLAAQRQLYSEAKRISDYQFVTSIVLPVSLVIVKSFFSFSNIVLGFYALLLILIALANIYVFEKHVKNKRERAARIQELFDTDVLQLEWNSELCGPRDQAIRDVKYLSTKYKKKNVSLESLKNWYPTEFARVDISAGRVMCQKINTSWDSQLRSTYQSFLVRMSVSCVLIVLIIAMIQNKSTIDTIITIVAPLFPVVSYILKRISDNKETTIRLDKLSDKSEDLWEEVLKFLNSPELKNGSRKLQNDIYKHRSSALIIWDWFYWFYRPKQEGDMGMSAKIMVDDYLGRVKQT